VEAFATAQQVYVFGLVFARVGSMIMVMPGLGEAALSPRLRLAFALLTAFCIAPTVASALPALDPTVGGVAFAVLNEVLIGLMIGTILRLFMSSLAMAGEIISIQTTLAFAQTSNPMQAQPSASITTFLTLTALTLIFVTNLHHSFLLAMAKSYSLFAPLKPLPLQDTVTLAIQTVSQSIALGVQLSAPVIVFSLVLNIATGLVGRVMPQFQIFFVATPLSVLLGLSLLALSVSMIGLIWIQRYESFLGVFD
jgi:flagellar biosynthetic protein FliR